MRRFFRRTPRSTSAKREIPATIAVSGRLLGLQSLGLLFLANLTAPDQPLAGRTFDELWQAGLFIVMAFVSVLAALGILRLRPLAWNAAMILEGAILLLTLSLYRGERPFYIYPLMVYGVLMVLNLNQPELRRSFPTEIIPAPVEVEPIEMEAEQ
jgi:hypothetical protein